MSTKDNRLARSWTQWYRRLRRYDKALAQHMGLASTLQQRVWTAAVVFTVVVAIQTLESALDKRPAAIAIWAAVTWLLGSLCGVTASLVWLGEIPQRQRDGLARSARRIALWTALCIALPLLAGGV